MFETGIRSKILINEIASPISKELVKADLELKTILNESDLILDSGITGRVLKKSGRRIRQAMILLPAKAIGKGRTDDKLSRLCAAAEIIYSAFNMHDGISGSGMTSGKTGRARKVIDNSRAVLTGDTLHTMALLVISEMFPGSMLLDVMQLIEKNSYMIISEEIKKPIFRSKESYINSLKSRTAELSTTFALLGAYVSEANADETAVLEKCGYNLGMAYQIITDNENGKTPFEKNDSQTFVKHFTDEARSASSGFKESIYKKSLLKLIEYFNQSKDSDVLNIC